MTTSGLGEVMVTLGSGGCAPERASCSYSSSLTPDKVSEAAYPVLSGSTSGVSKPSSSVAGVVAGSLSFGGGAASEAVMASRLYKVGDKKSRL